MLFCRAGVSILEKSPKIREIFHSFRSVVQDTKESAHKTVLITIQTPKFIGQDQRRKCLRISPEISSFVSIEFWPFNATGNFEMNSPKLVLSDFILSNARIFNISAGGVKLIINRDKLKEISPEFQRGTRLVLHLKIHEISRTNIDECWLLAKATNAVVDFATKDIHVGMEFVSYGTEDSECKKIIWNNVFDNVVEDVAAWVHQWHVNLYREENITKLENDLSHADEITLQDNR
ncbi:MAG: hypothetical protein HQK81_14015 [Desulfovibrionaceae bacterium]|nr:hypothetical protein [Desulfovibrionaceae bacterium]